MNITPSSTIPSPIITFSYASTHFNISNPASLISQMPNVTSGTNNNSTSNRFTSARQELFTNFRPSLTVPFNVIQRLGRYINSQSKNTTLIQQTIKLNYLILMDKVDSVTIFKVNGDLWNDLVDAELIKLNIILSENNLNQQIYDLFLILTGQEWKVFSPKSEKLKNVQNMVYI